MKKSEFERERKEYWKRRGISNPMLEADVDAAEAAGVTWEPEGEPAQGQAPAPEPARLPERLVLNAGPSPGKISVPLGPAGVRPLSAEEEREAVRRYNEWDTLTESEQYWHRECRATRARLSDTTVRAEKAEAEVKRLGGVLDELRRRLA